jgi:GTP 3',8-cyclase
VNGYQKWNEQSRAYTQCNAMRFWTYIDSRADVWGCCNHHGDERFLCGNLHEQTFQEIWEGEQRRRVVTWVENEFDISCCRINCRMDEVNRYLWDLKNPPDHANFI